VPGPNYGYNYSIYSVFPAVPDFCHDKMPVFCAATSRINSDAMKS